MRRLPESGLSPERLELEVTETVLLQNNEENTSILLHQFRERGISISLDDSGIGYSIAEATCRSFPFDRIKIDRSRSWSIRQPDDAAFGHTPPLSAKAVSGPCRAHLDIKTTAEGVETEEQMLLLRAASAARRCRATFSAGPVRNRTALRRRREYVSRRTSRSRLILAALRPAIPRCGRIDRPMDLPRLAITRFDRPRPRHAVSRLSLAPSTMPLDAIVNAANTSRSSAAAAWTAPSIALPARNCLKECKALGGCDTGSAKITRGYNLPARYVIHAVGPVWHGGAQRRRCAARLLLHNRPRPRAREQPCVDRLSRDLDRHLSFSIRPRRAHRGRHGACRKCRRIRRTH